MYQLDYSEGQWKKLDYNRKRKKLEIKNATAENIGLYRCRYNETIIKIYIVDLVGNYPHSVFTQLVRLSVSAKYAGTKPEVLSVMASPNSTIVPTSQVVIQCKVKSEIPPEIRWFKECTTRSCEDFSRLRYDGSCYCSLDTSNPGAYPRGDSNIYMSKLFIPNSSNGDSGTYVCVVITVYGENHKNVTIKVGDMNDNVNNSGNSINSFRLLFLIPLFFVLVPVTIWLGFYRRKKKSRRQLHEHQKHQLIQPVIEL